jgi:hypothetical protein
LAVQRRVEKPWAGGNRRRFDVGCRHRRGAPDLRTGGVAVGSRRLCRCARRRRSDRWRISRRRG